MVSLHQLHPAPVVGDDPTEVGIDCVLDPLLAEHVGQLGNRHEGGAGALADSDRVGVMVHVRVCHEDVGRVDVVRRDLSRRVVRLQEGIDEDARVAVHQLHR